MKKLLTLCLLAVACSAACAADTAAIVTPAEKPPPPKVQPIAVPETLKAGFVTWLDSLVPPSPTRNVIITIAVSSSNTTTRVMVTRP